MPFLHLRRFLPQSASSLYALVSDVNAYQEFLPWCIKSAITQKTPTGFLANLTIGTSALHQTFCSVVTLFPEKTIDVLSEGGSLKYLKTQWNFHENTQGTRVDFFLDFAMHSRFLQKILEISLERSIPIMMASFEKRAFTI